MRQSYSQDFLQHILDAYDHVGSIQDSYICASGFENSNYVVITEVGKYVVKIFEGESVTELQVAFELEAMERSYVCGVKTPHVYRTLKNALYTRQESKIVMLMDYVHGQNMDGQSCADSCVYELGLELGKMDTALSLYTDGSLTRQHYEFDLKTFSELNVHMNLLPAYVNRQIYEEVFSSFEKRKNEFLELPTGLIHNDAAAHNIIANEGHIACIIDFSDMAYSPYIQNIAVAVAQTVFAENWQPTQLAHFMRGYTAHRSVTKTELSFLYDLVRARYVQIVLAFCDWNNRFGDDAQRVAYIAKSNEYLNRITELGRDSFDTVLYAV